MVRLPCLSIRHDILMILTGMDYKASARTKCFHPNLTNPRARDVLQDMKNFANLVLDSVAIGHSIFAGKI